MKVFLISILLFALTIMAVLADDPKVSITTNDGKKYENVTISRVEPDGLVLVTDSGIEKVPFISVPPEVQRQYGYDPDKAVSYQQAVSQQRNLAQQKAKQDAVVREVEKSGYDARVEIIQVLDNGILAEGSFLVPGEEVYVLNEGKTEKTYKWKPTGTIFIQGAGKGFADGETWNGRLWEVGTYRYEKVTGATATVRKFVITAREAIKEFQKSSFSESINK